MRYTFGMEPSQEINGESTQMIVEQKEPFITIDDFKKVKAQLGTVVSAEAVADSDKLIRFSIDFGLKPSEDESSQVHDIRQILSAIREWYSDPSLLIGKQLLFCTNLAPRTIRGYESNGMLMAVDGVDGAPVFLPCWWKPSSSTVDFRA